LTACLIWIVLLAISLLLVAIATLVASGRKRFRAMVSSNVAELYSEPAQEVGSMEMNQRWESLPEPVRRHLRYAIYASRGPMRTARLKHGGFFRTRPGQRWLPIQGEEYFTIRRPGFVWDASIRLAPGLWIEARDRLHRGRGHMLVKLWSAFKMADARGAEIDQGALLRWLAEVVWFPFGFVGEAIQWEAVDARSARATIIEGGSPLSAIFEGDEEGKFVRLRANRYWDVGGGKTVLTPWVGLCNDYRDFGGVRIPAEIEVHWQLEQGDFSYARFRVTALEFNVPGRF